MLYRANVTNYDKGLRNMLFVDICFTLLDKIRKSVVNCALKYCDYYGYM